jgi:hypothetical protein
LVKGLLRTVIGIDSLTVCIFFGEISIFFIQELWERKSLQILTGVSCTLGAAVYLDSSNNCAKFEVNWPRGSQFAARHTKNRLQFDE